MALSPRCAPVLAAGAALCALGLSFSAQTLIPRSTGDRLQVTAPGLHFLSGGALERLHNGASVPYDFQLTLSTVPRGFPLERALDRFVISYDLWEERFSAVEMRGARKTASHLTPAAAESWCIGQMGVGESAAPAGSQLWLRLEVRAEDSAPVSPIGDSGLSLTGLIEIFSRSAPAQTQKWIAETQPFRLQDLKR